MTVIERSPPLTVIMPVYNAMPFLPEAVDSILRQSMGDFEFIIVDDGSTDGSSGYLAKLADRRVRVLRQENRGQGHARNTALRHVITPFLALMDADDFSHPLRLEKQLRFLREHRDIGMLGTGFQYIGAEGRKGLSPPLPGSHDEIVSHLLKTRHAIVNATIMARTDIVREIGGYRIEGFGEDWDFFLRMGERTRLANLGEVLFYYRVNLGSSTYKRFREMRLRFDYSAHCARRRGQGLSEATWEEYLAEREGRGTLERVLAAMDEHALYQYKRALDDLLNAKPAAGWLRLGYAALSSPRLTARRLLRGLAK